MAIPISIRIVIIHENKILLVNNFRDGFYYLPGGEMEFMEDLNEAAEREIREELGENIKFTFKRILFISDFLNSSKAKHKHEIYISGELNEYEKINKKDPGHDGGDEFIWVPVDRLPESFKPGFFKIELQQYLSDTTKYEVKYLVNRVE